MLEKQCDLWTEPCDAFCITTNGFVKHNGRAVMGRGCAKEARERFPNIDIEWANEIVSVGNKFCILQETSRLTSPKFICSFPVKHTWWEKADLDLIKESAIILVEYADAFAWDKVLVPRPGCGNGQLDWETEVKPILEPLLDDRFVIVYK